MTASRPQFIRPPSDEEIRYPYRRVWRSLLLEWLFLLILVLPLWLAEGWIQNILLEAVLPAVRIVIASIPLVLWLIFSLSAERLALQPRRHLVLVAVISALVANAVGYPLLTRVLTLNDWIAQATLFEQILVRTLTFGVIQEALKYLVIYYLVPLDAYRTRLDALAYTLAGSVGYITVILWHFALAQPALSLGFLALDVFIVTHYHWIGSLFLGYGMAQLQFDRPFVFWLAGIIAISSTLIGLLMTLTGTFSNSALGIPVSSPRTWLMLLLSVAFLLLVILIVSFLFNVAERAEKETP